MNQPSFPFERGIHLQSKAFFKIRLPSWIVGISLCTDLRMPFDTDGGGCEQSDDFHLSFLTFENTSKDPSIGSFIRKVFVLYPPTRFMPMLATYPFPNGLEDGMIYGVEDRFTDHVAMIERPTPNHWIEFCNEFTSGQIATFPDTFSDLAHERFNVLLRWSDEELYTFSSPVFSYRLSEKVEALFNMRDDGFLFREL